MYTEMPSSGLKQDTPPPPYSEGAAPWGQKKPPDTPDPSAGNVRTVIVVENFQVKVPMYVVGALIKKKTDQKNCFIFSKAFQHIVPEWFDFS